MRTCVRLWTLTLTRSKSPSLAAIQMFFPFDAFAFTIFAREVVAGSRRKQVGQCEDCETACQVASCSYEYLPLHTEMTASPSVRSHVSFRVFLNGVVVGLGFEGF